MKMADVIHRQHQIAIVLNRFGILLGLGDKTVEQVCVACEIQLDFFLAIVNVFCDKSYFPRETLKNFSMNLIIDYLKKSHHYYNHTKVPAIEEMIQKLCWKNPENETNVVLVNKFWLTYKEELQTHTEYEEQVVFPYMLGVERVFEGRHSDLLPSKYSIDVFEVEHNDLEEKLFDLKNIIIKYLPPPENFDLCNSILFELFRLEKDLNNHARIEDKVMIPKVKEMEKTIARQKSSKKENQ